MSEGSIASDGRWIPPEGKWWRISLRPVCFAVIVDKTGTVVWAAPVGRWTIGKQWLTVKAHYLRRGGWVDEIEG